MAKNTCWGIDVGQCALKAIKLRLSGGEVEAVSFDVIEHAKILSQPDADEQQLIRNALDKFLSRNDVKNDLVVVGVPGQASFSRFIKLPPVELKKVPEIVKYEARQQIPFNLDEVIWDYQTMTMPSGGPAELEVGIFAMKRDIVQDYVNDFTQVKITPDAVQMGSVALYNYLQFDRQDGAGATLLVDVGAENTSLVIADGYRVWIRNFPLGGNSFTQALVKSFKLTFSKAENLKRHAAESKHAREIFQAMRPVFSDLLTEIQRSIGFYTAMHRESRIERVLAMGNSFRLAGLQKFLSQNLGVEVTPVSRFNSLKGDQVTEAPVFKENVLSFGVAYGLALQGLGMGTITTSLLPPEILKAKEVRRKRPFVAAAALAVIAGCALLAYGAKEKSTAMIANEPPDLGSIDSAKGALRDIEKLKADNDKAKGEFDKARRQLVVAQQNIDELDSLVDVSPFYLTAVPKTADGKPVRRLAPRSFWNQALKDIWEVLPKDPTMLEPELYKTQEVWPTMKVIEVLNIWGEVVVYNTTTKMVIDANTPKVAGLQDDLARVMIIYLEGTIPNVGAQVPAQVVEEVLQKPLNEKGYMTKLDQAPIPYAAAPQTTKYPYEHPDPRIKAADDEAKAKVAGTTVSEKKDAEVPPAMLRPYRGGDFWFRLKLTVNLDNPDVKVDVVTTGEPGTESPGGPSFEPGPSSGPPPPDMGGMQP